MLASILGRHGHTITTASDGEEALSRAIKTRPDLIITDVTMPRMDGWAFIRSVRSRPELALTPVIFLTGLSSENERGRGFRLGPDEYLPKPFRFEELERRVTKLLARRRGPPAATADDKQGARASGAIPKPAGVVGGRRRDDRSPPAPDADTAPKPVREAGAPEAPVPESESRSVLHGALDQIGLGSLLIMLELERKSGMLILHRRGELGRLYLRQGRIIRAQMEGSGAWTPGVETVYHLLSWNDGRFDFSRMQVDGDDEVGSSTTRLLLEGARREDEAGNKGGS